MNDNTYELWLLITIGLIFAAYLFSEWMEWIDSRRPIAKRERRRLYKAIAGRQRQQREHDPDKYAEHLDRAATWIERNTWNGRARQ